MQVTVDEAQARLAELIEAALQGETVLIAMDERRIVQVTPFTRPRRRRRVGSARGHITLRDDFDTSSEGFAENMP